MPHICVKRERETETEKCGSEVQKYNSGYMQSPDSSEVFREGLSGLTDLLVVPCVPGVVAKCVV